VMKMKCRNVVSRVASGYSDLPLGDDQCGQAPGSAFGWICGEGCVRVETRIACRARRSRPGVRTINCVHE
jgi:hypothetical protein